MAYIHLTAEGAPATSLTILAASASLVQPACSNPPASGQGDKTLVAHHAGHAFANGRASVESFHAGNNHALNAAHSTNKLPLWRRPGESRIATASSPTCANDRTGTVLHHQQREKTTSCCGRISFTTSAERGGSNNVRRVPKAGMKTTVATVRGRYPCGESGGTHQHTGDNHRFGTKRSAIAPPKIPRPC